MQADEFEAELDEWLKYYDFTASSLDEVADVLLEKLEFKLIHNYILDENKEIGIDNLPTRFHLDW